ncbi:hypothetical protein FIV34_17645 [Luteibacter pinisoli]|uniref:Uncharacterized protein n=1 Tax=Luteibacter pinisoli TaxID=2589080 RepID=A0A4Y5Z6U0_9GAMM|nr:hypothetical protein [Luteibacter pinisoli]QDE40904.1 hypothetical protein FIV34_17645 [Luteibacter pinisoli]
MITPEFVSEERGEFIFVSNHSLSSDEHVSRSIEYNRARILNARAHLPAHLSRCRLFYDVRGQNVTEDILGRLSTGLSDLCAVEIKR